MKTAKRRTRRHRTRKHKKIRRLRHKTTRRVGGGSKSGSGSRTPLGFEYAHPPSSYSSYSSSTPYGFDPIIPTESSSDPSPPQGIPHIKNITNILGLNPKNLELINKADIDIQHTKLEIELDIEETKDKIQKVQKFIANLQKKIKLKWYFWDDATKNKKLHVMELQQKTLNALYLKLAILTIKNKNEDDLTQGEKEILLEHMLKEKENPQKSIEKRVFNLNSRETRAKQRNKAVWLEHQNAFNEWKKAQVEKENKLPRQGYKQTWEG